MDRTIQIDRCYLRICREYANLSRCYSRHIGALLVNPDGIVIGLGVNGPPRGISHCDQRAVCKHCSNILFDYSAGSCDEVCPKCGKSDMITIEGRCPRHIGEVESGLSDCPAVHGEINALLACGRTNNSTKGGTLYIWPIGPCKDCSAQIIQAGISRLVYPESEPYDMMGPWLLNQSGITITNYPLSLLDDPSFNVH